MLGDMSRNAGSDENGRFDKFLLAILTKLAKVVNVRIFGITDDSDEISPRLWAK